MKRWIKGTLAALSCAALAAMPVSAAPAYIIQQGDGATVQELLDPDSTVWAPLQDLPTDAAALQIEAKGAVLMELSTGQILFAQNADERLPIASVTKVMTLLLIMEAVDQGLLGYDERITCSANAASMGGSQIWLEEGESMTVDQLLKAIAVVSANDACVMMAEHLCGSAEEFVRRMNLRAAQLGMTDTQFLDCSGLNDEGYSSAADVAKMSRELMLHHPDITRYTTIWTDTLRNGQSQLVNTNKLVRHYSGATGLKTGTTAAAGYCLSATAQRDGMGLVAVVLGSDTTDHRFGGARKMLDYGFASYTLCLPQTEGLLPPGIKVLHGEQSTVAPVADTPSPLLLRKGGEKALSRTVQLCADVQAPVEAGQILGRITYTLDGQPCGTCPIRAARAVPRLTFGGALKRLLRALVQ